jgi:hypothetical protein
MIDISKKWIIPILILIILVLSGYFIIDTFNHLTQDTTCENPGSGTGSGGGQGRSITQSYYILIVFIVIICILTPMLYVLISRNIKKQLEDKMNLISEIVEKNGKATNQDTPDKTTKSVFLKFLDYGENQVIKKLIENNGRVLQSEISRMPNMGKVRAHRIISELKKKEIITLEKYGKTNRVYLTDDVKNIFLK